MAIQDCRAPYAKDGSYIPTAPKPPIPMPPEQQTATAPGFPEKRSRLFAGGTFFRSKLGSTSANLIEVAYRVNPSDSDQFFLDVYNDGTLEETFGPVNFDVPDLLATEPPFCVLSANATMRGLVNEVSDFIQMPPLDFGGNAGGPSEFEAGNLPSDDPPGDDCAVAFSRTFLTGGNGPPTDASSLNSIYTGPERTLVILTVTEIVNDNSSDPGILVDPPPDQKVRQFDGVGWIPYIPNEDCCIIGVDCP